MKDISYLVISDVHLNHPRNKTSEIVANLDSYFDDYTQRSQFTNLDIIFIAGDLFDSLLDLSGSEVHDITLWLGRLMDFCARYNIKLRILEGTPSHDWKQSKIAETVFGLIDKPFDFKYIDTLHIEEMSDLGLKIIYVPDEWNACTQQTYNQVRSLMQELSLDEVDIAIMHGLFQHQMPPMAKNLPIHDASSYLSIVKHFINIGHIHTFSVYDRILAEGSFDRLSHGEEEPKGGVLCRISYTHGDSYEFIENKRAKIFKTIVLKFKDMERSLSQVEKVLSKVPDNSYVRIKANKNHPLYVAFDKLKIRYPMYFFSKVSLEDETDDQELIEASVKLDEQYIPIAIQSENIVSLIMSEVRSKHHLTEKQNHILNHMLENLNHG